MSARPAVSSLLQRLKPRRRWFQYRLRTLLLLVAVGGIGARWVGVVIVRASRQAAAIATVTAHGGRVEQRGPDIAPTWVSRIFGIHAGGTVTTLWFENGGTDSDLSLLGDFPDIQWVAVGGPAISDEGLKHLAGRSQLLILGVSEANITDAGLRHLRALPELSVLILTCRGITDAGLEHLATLPKLEELYLSHSRITDRGLMKLAGLNQLCRLWVDDTLVTADGIAKFQAARPECVVQGP